MFSVKTHDHYIVRLRYVMSRYQTNRECLKTNKPIFQLNKPEEVGGVESSEERREFDAPIQLNNPGFPSRSIMERCPSGVNRDVTQRPFPCISYISDPAGRYLQYTVHILYLRYSLGRTDHTSGWWGEGLKMTHMYHG
jgi:hypothetical protein